MASLVWTSVYIFLIIELAITFTLVVPVPRKIRNIIARNVFRLKLSEKFQKPIWLIAVGLVVAFCDSYLTLERLNARSQQEHDLAGFTGGTATKDRIYYDLDKQRGYKAQRNLYLAGFALTLLFVIYRITQLMAESVEMEKEIKELTILKDHNNETKNSGNVINVNVASVTGEGVEGVEMTSLKSKKEK